MVRRFVSVGIASVALAITAGAQAADAKNVLSIQPLSAMFGVYSVEFERVASTSLTWGLGANNWNGFFDSGDDDERYVSAEFKVRFYPDGTPLKGFSFGGAVGFSSITGTNFDGSSWTEGGPSLGILLEYQWLLGAKDNVAVALGAGAKALQIERDAASTASDFTAKYPTVRISVGFRF